MPKMLIDRKTLAWGLAIIALVVALQAVPAAWAAPEGAELGQTVPRTPVPTWTPLPLPAPGPDEEIWVSSDVVEFTAGSPLKVGMNAKLAADPPAGSRLRISIDSPLVRFLPGGGLGQVSEDGTEIYFDAAATDELDLTNLQLDTYFAADVLPGTEVKFIVTVIDANGSEYQIEVTLTLAPAVLPATGA